MSTSAKMCAGLRLSEIIAYRVFSNYVAETLAVFAMKGWTKQSRLFQSAEVNGWAFF